MDNQPLGNEYLQQIQASVTPKKSLLDNKLVLMIGGLLLVLVLVLVISLILSSGSTSTSQRSKTLYLQLTNLQTSSTKYQDDLKDSNLRAINSSFSTQLTNSIRDLTAALKEQKIDVAKLDKKAKFYVDQTKHSDDLNAQLTNAKLNVILDRTYSTSMSYELELILNNIAQITAHSRSTSFRQTLDNIASNLRLIQQSFDDFAKTS
ncbi:hypothetical protein FWF48_00325 [Candidatus Saccharibacteria bacterium]|nr:hypothetical protein [Candidatus Saccharibacteria bacterium]